MLALDLTETEYQTLTNPTQIQMWGEQQAIARKIFEQIAELHDGDVETDVFDYIAINKAVEALHEGIFIAQPQKGNWGALATPTWSVSANQLKKALGR